MINDDPFATLPPDALVLVTIYGPSREYPSGYTVRRCLVPPSPGAGIVAEPIVERTAHHCGSLIEAREIAVELGGSMPLGRMPGDDPCIVETWI